MAANEWMEMMFMMNHESDKKIVVELWFGAGPM